MDCPADKVRVSSSAGVFEFTCKGDSESYKAEFVLQDYENEALVSYAAILDEEDGCHWDPENGGEDSCVSSDGTDYPEDCSSSSGTTTIYY